MTTQRRKQQPATQPAATPAPITVTTGMVLAPEVNAFIRHAMRDAHAEQVGTPEGQERFAALLRHRGWTCTPPRAARTRKAVA